MDIEDSNLLFDEDQISARLDLLIVKYLKTAQASYTEHISGNPAFDTANMYITSLKAAVAELIAQNNRVLWHNVQQLLAESEHKSDSA